MIQTGLMVTDEILTEAIYCGPHCLYSIPLIGDVTYYQTECFIWTLILGGVLLLLCSGFYILTKLLAVEE